MKHEGGYLLYKVKNSQLHVDTSVSSPLISEPLYKEKTVVVSGNKYIEDKYQEKHNNIFNTPYSISKSGVGKYDFAKYGTTTIGGTPSLELINYEKGTRKTYAIYFKNDNKIYYKGATDTNETVICEYDSLPTDYVKVWILIVGGGGGGNTGSTVRGGSGGGAGATCLFPYKLKRGYTIVVSIGGGGAGVEKNHYADAADGGKSTVITIFDSSGIQLNKIEAGGGSGGGGGEMSITPSQGGTVTIEGSLSIKYTINGGKGGIGAQSLSNAGGNGETLNYQYTKIDYEEPYRMTALTHVGGNGAPKDPNGKNLAAGGGGASAAPGGSTRPGHGGGYGNSQTYFSEPGYGGGGYGGCGDATINKGGNGGNGAFAIWCL